MSTPEGKQISGFIEPAQWQNFLDGFSKRNQGRATRLEVIGELGAQEEEEYLPLVGVSLDPKGTAAGSVEIMLAGEGPADDRQVEHTIRHVQKIAPLVEITGVEDGLGFEDQEGAKTVVLLGPSTVISLKPLIEPPDDPILRFEPPHDTYLPFRHHECSIARESEHS